MLFQQSTATNTITRSAAPNSMRPEFRGELPPPPPLPPLPPLPPKMRLAPSRNCCSRSSKPPPSLRFFQGSRLPPPGSFHAIELLQTADRDWTCETRTSQALQPDRRISARLPRNCREPHPEQQANPLRPG